MFVEGLFIGNKFNELDAAQLVEAFEVRILLNERFFISAFFPAKQKLT